MGIGEDHPGGVGVGAVNVAGGDVHLKALLAGQLRGQTDTRVVGLHAHDACDQRLVGAVALVSLGKGAVKQDVRFHRFGTKKRSGDAPDPRRSGGVGAGGADHHGPQDVEYIHMFICLSVYFREGLWAWVLAIRLVRAAACGGNAAAVGIGSCETYGLSACCGQGRPWAGFCRRFLRKRPIGWM